MESLPDHLYREILRLALLGDTLAAKGAYVEAIVSYHNALQLVPEPRNTSEPSTWLLTAIGEAYFFAGDFSAGSKALANALTCPGGIENASIHLRLGQCYFETGNLSGAAQALMRAYSIAGADIFGQDSPKYFEFLKTRMPPPASHVVAVF